jgi:hypothetical protein
MKPITAKFSKREEDLELTGDRVIDQTENNPDYPDPPPARAELKKELPEFSAARLNAQGGDKKMVSIKNDKKAIILALLQALADYVTVKSKGDRTLILSSGFDVNERRSTRNMAPAIGKLEVELGEAGVVTIRTKDVTGVKAYIHQYTTEAPGLNTVWHQEGSSQGEHIFEGLSSDKRYWFRVVAIGYNKQRALSPVVSRVIQ